MQEFVPSGPGMQCPPLSRHCLQKKPSGPPNPTQTPCLQVLPGSHARHWRKPPQPSDTNSQDCAMLAQVCRMQTLHWLSVQIWLSPQVPVQVMVSPQPSSVVPQLFATQ